MENASKALIMAGSILISLLIIGALVFMFNSLSAIKQTEASSDEVQKLAEYNKQIETYNRKGLYGSEVLSLANLITDYNKRQADLKGYVAITLNVKVNASTVRREYLNLTNYNDITLIQQFNRLQNAIDASKTGIHNTVDLGNGQKVTIERAAGMKDSDLIQLITAANPTWRQSQIETKMNEIRDTTDKYTDLKTEMTQFKNKKFQNPNVTYDTNGRIKTMYFEEIPN